MSEKRVESVYAMLGYPDHEAMAVKACLASQISEVIKSRGLKQAEAAEIIGIPQPKLSNLLRGQFRGVSEAKMIECLAALGRDVDIVIKAAAEGEVGRVRIVGPTAAIAQPTADASRKERGASSAPQPRRAALPSAR